MKTYYCKLLPPRSTFAQDMSAVEANVMHEHVAYWREQMAMGKVVVFGPVADPAGPFGVAILEVSDEDEVLGLTARDPAIRAAQGFRYDIHLMPRGAIYPRPRAC